MLLCCIGGRITETIDAIPNIDFENSMYHITTEDTATKKHKRSIPFLPELFDEKSKEHLHELTADTIQDYFFDLFKKLGLDEIVVHSFRVTFISVANFVGVPLKIIQELAGHEDLKTTANTYVKLFKRDGTSPIVEYMKKYKKMLQENGYFDDTY